MIVDVNSKLAKLVGLSYTLIGFFDIIAAKNFYAFLNFMASLFGGVS